MCFSTAKTITVFQTVFKNIGQIKTNLSPFPTVVLYGLERDICYDCRLAAPIKQLMCDPSASVITLCLTIFHGLTVLAVLDRHDLY